MNSPFSETFCRTCKTSHDSVKEYLEHIASMTHHLRASQKWGNNVRHFCLFCCKPYDSIEEFGSHLQLDVHKGRINKFRQSLAAGKPIRQLIQEKVIADPSKSDCCGSTETLRKSLTKRTLSPAAVGRQAHGDQLAQLAKRPKSRKEELIVQKLVHDHTSSNQRWEISERFGSSLENLVKEATAVSILQMLSEATLDTAGTVLHDVSLNSNSDASACATGTHAVEDPDCIEVLNPLEKVKREVVDLSSESDSELQPPTVCSEDMVAAVRHHLSASARLLEIDIEHGEIKEQLEVMDKQIVRYVQMRMRLLHRQKVLEEEQRLIADQKSQQEARATAAAVPSTDLSRLLAALAQASPNPQHPCQTPPDVVQEEVRQSNTPADVRQSTPIDVVDVPDVTPAAQVVVKSERSTPSPCAGSEVPARAGTADSAPTLAPPPTVESISQPRGCERIMEGVQSRGSDISDGQAVHRKRVDAAAAGGGSSKSDGDVKPYLQRQSAPFLPTPVSSTAMPINNGRGMSTARTVIPQTSKTIPTTDSPGTSIGPTSCAAPPASVIVPSCASGTVLKKKVKKRSKRAPASLPDPKGSKEMAERQAPVARPGMKVQFMGYGARIVALQAYSGKLFSCSSDGSARCHMMLSTNKHCGTWTVVREPVTTYVEVPRDVCAMQLLHTQGNNSYVVLCSRMGHLVRYSTKKSSAIHQVSTNLPLLCMALCWNIVFLGTVHGEVHCYSPWNFTFMRVMVASPLAIACLATSSEYGCRFLGIGSMDGFVCIRNAFSGIMDRWFQLKTNMHAQEIHFANGHIYTLASVHGVSHDIYVHSFEDCSFLHHLSSTVCITNMAVSKAGHIVFAKSDGSLRLYKERCSEKLATLNNRMEKNSRPSALIVTDDVITIGTEEGILESWFYANHETEL